MTTLILATSSLHFVNAILLADQFDSPHLVLSGYHDARARQFLDWLEGLESPIFCSAQYRFMRTAKQVQPILKHIEPDVIVTGNDDIREYQVINFVAKRLAQNSERVIAFHYMDDGLNSYAPPPAVVNRCHFLRNVFRYLSKGYMRDVRSQIGQSHDLSRRYLYHPEKFPVRDGVDNKRIKITPQGRARLAELTRLAVQNLDIPDNSDLVLLPNEKTIKDSAAFLENIERIIEESEQRGRQLILKSHPSDSKHLTKPFARKNSVTFIEARIPAELMLAGIAPNTIYSGKSTILLTAELLFPDIKIVPLTFN